MYIWQKIFSTQSKHTMGTQDKVTEYLISEVVEIPFSTYLQQHFENTDNEVQNLKRELFFVRQENLYFQNKINQLLMHSEQRKILHKEVQRKKDDEFILEKIKVRHPKALFDMKLFLTFVTQVAELEEKIEVTQMQNEMLVEENNLLAQLSEHLLEQKEISSSQEKNKDDILAQYETLQGEHTKLLQEFRLYASKQSSWPNVSFFVKILSLAQRPYSLINN